MSTDHDADDVRKRPFGDFLRDQSNGALHEELTEKFHELIGAIADTGKKGVLVMQLVLEPNKKNPDMFMVTDDVRVKTPQPEKRASIFYADDDGNLTRTDPNQPSFDGLLREVEAPAAATEAKTIPTPKEKQA